MTQIAVIIADGEIDSICEWDHHATEHITDLREMGCTVKRRLFPSWPAAEQFEDYFNGNTAGALWADETSEDDPSEVAEDIRRFGTLPD